MRGGMIWVSGSTTLSDWSSGSDATKIDGGKIYTQSITATQIAASTITTGELNFTPVTLSGGYVNGAVLAFSDGATSSAFGHNAWYLHNSAGSGEAIDATSTSIIGTSNSTQTWNINTPTGRGSFTEFYLNGSQLAWGSPSDATGPTKKRTLNLGGVSVQIACYD